jgi:hypothetical protein
MPGRGCEYGCGRQHVYGCWREPWPWRGVACSRGRGNRCTYGRERERAPSWTSADATTDIVVDRQDRRRDRVSRASA